MHKTALSAHLKTLEMPVPGILFRILNIDVQRKLNQVETTWQQNLPSSIKMDS
jgi:hypothetical protein